MRTFVYAQRENTRTRGTQKKILRKDPDKEAAQAIRLKFRPVCKRTFESLKQMFREQRGIESFAFAAPLDSETSASCVSHLSILHLRQTSGACHRIIFSRVYAGHARARTRCIAFPRRRRRRGGAAAFQRGARLDAIFRARVRQQRNVTLLSAICIITSAIIAPQPIGGWPVCVSTTTTTTTTTLSSTLR